MKTVRRGEKMTEVDFESCISMLQSGDMEGLRIIYVEYSKMIYSAVLNVTHNSHAAEDVTSEFFLKLKKAASVYRKGSGHKKWLITAARNLAIDHIRKSRHEISIEAGGGDDESHPLSEIPDNTDVESSVSARMDAKSMLAVLNDAEREIVDLKIYCELTFSEISDVLHIPIGTAAWRYNAAVKKLKKIYGEVLV